MSSEYQLLASDCQQGKQIKFGNYPELCAEYVYYEKDQQCPENLIIALLVNGDLVVMKAKCDKGTDVTVGCYKYKFQGTGAEKVADKECSQMLTFRITKMKC